MLRKKFFINFFYQHIIDMDVFNETLKDLLARNGGNYRALARELDNVCSSNYLSMLVNKKRGKAGKPPIDLVEKIKEKYGVDPMTGKSVVTTVTQEKTSDLTKLVSAFESAVAAFKSALDSNQENIKDLRNDKKVMLERETWLRQHIDSLTTGFATLKQA